MSLDLPTGWAGAELTGRMCATYCLVPIEELPRLDRALDGNLGWLENPGRPLEWAIGQSEPDRIFDPSTVDGLRSACAAVGITVPRSLELLLTTERRDWIRSPTGCYLELAEQMVHIPGTDTYAVRFLNDQQGVLFWYAAVDRNGEQGVVVSNDLFDVEVDGGWLQDEDQRQSFRCADSVEDFLYRYWLEAEIYFRSMESQEFTPAMERYLEQ